jgi:hypothetical protein
MATVTQEKYDQNQGAQHHSAEQKHGPVITSALQLLGQCCAFMPDVVDGRLKTSIMLGKR